MQLVSLTSLSLSPEWKTSKIFPGSFVLKFFRPFAFHLPEYSESETWKKICLDQVGHFFQKGQGTKGTPGGTEAQRYFEFVAPEASAYKEGWGHGEEAQKTGQFLPSGFPTYREKEGNRQCGLRHRRELGLCSHSDSVFGWPCDLTGWERSLVKWSNHKKGWISVK